MRHVLQLNAMDLLNSVEAVVLPPESSDVKEHEPAAGLDMVGA